MVRTRRKATEPGADFIIKAAPRLVKIAALTCVAFGHYHGAAHAIRNCCDDPNYDYDWQQTALAAKRFGEASAIMTAAALLDRGPIVVSFQTVYHLIKNRGVRDALLKQLNKRYGDFDEAIGKSRGRYIDDFIGSYKSIDWKIYGRLKHLRDLGIAQLLTTTRSRSITHNELRSLIIAITDLALALQSLCQTATALHLDEHEAWH